MEKPTITGSVKEMMAWARIS